MCFLSPKSSHLEYHLIPEASTFSLIYHAKSQACSQAPTSAEMPLLDQWSPRCVRGNTVTETAHTGQAGTMVTICVSYAYWEVPVRNTKLLSHHQWEKLGKGQKETRVSYHLPESFSLASILAEQSLGHQEGP